MADRDGNGVLDLEELGLALEQIGFCTPGSLIAEITSRYSENQSVEFLDFFRSMRPNGDVEVILQHV